MMLVLKIIKLYGEEKTYIFLKNKSWRDFKNTAKLIQR
jgi:hypothetical protein